MSSEAAQRKKAENKFQAFSEALEGGALQQVRKMLNALHPAEIAHLLESLPPPERNVLWELVDPEDDGEVLLHVNDDVRADLIRSMKKEELVAATEGLDLDDLADLLRDLPDAVIGEVLHSMDAQHRRRLEAVLAYPEDTAGGLMNTDTITVRGDVTLDVVLRYLRLRGELPELTDSLIVVNRFDRYLGVLPLTDLLTSSPELTVAEVMDRSVEAIDANLSAEEVAKIFEDRDLVSAAVVDENGALLGRITIDDVVDVIREEARQSLMGMAGLQEDEDLFAPVWKKAQNRWPWLAINLVTAFVASRIISAFEHTIGQLVALAALMPIVAAVGGNTGNQTVALIVRALALGQVTPRNALRLLMKEAGVSLLNGVVWGSVVGMFAYMFYHDMMLAIVMGSALVLNLLIAALAGVLIPLTLRGLGRDPALGSSILLTATTDSMGFLVFLGLATIFLI
ncbi:MAG: magnesium transporter [Gammaproteobacteria bacterium]